MGYRLLKLTMPFIHFCMITEGACNANKLCSLLISLGLNRSLASASWEGVICDLVSAHP